MQQTVSAGKRLLEAARRIFAERGLVDGSLRDICAKANANIALVKYHFGGKEQLYIAVLDAYLSETAQRYPLDEGLAPDATPEARLRAFIRGFLKRIQGYDDPVEKGLSRIVAQEIFAPSPAFEPLLVKHIRPSHERLLSIVSALLPEADDNTVLRCAHSISGQCISYDFTRDALSRMQLALDIMPGELDSMVEYIAEFSLGGIERLKSRLS
jgi:AcrR family transcriptional regulator